MLTTNLYDLTPDDIIREIEEAMDELRPREISHKHAEVAFKAYEAGAILAFVDSGKSNTEAEKRVRTQPNWAQQYTQLQDAHCNYLHAKRKLELAHIKAELWRSEQANRRRI